MKVLVAYSSLTGNTKKVGQAINEIIKGDFVDIKENPKIDDYDKIIVGYWADKGKADQIADEFLKTIKNKKCGVFATVGAYGDSQHAQDVLNYGVKLLEANGNQVTHTFVCQGKIDEKLTKAFEKFPKDHPHYMDEARRKRHEDAKSHPDENDLKRAKEAFINFV